MMVHVQRAALAENARTMRQRIVRYRASQLPWRVAVRMAARAFFHFTHRARSDKALWSESERVWLGSQTFLHWAMSDDDIDIPWLVAGVSGAPEEADELESAVRRELLAYWGEQLAALPQKSTPRWLPLP
jgi:hypothetical protein